MNAPYPLKASFLTPKNLLVNRFLLFSLYIDISVLILSECSFCVKSQRMHIKKEKSTMFTNCYFSQYNTIVQLFVSFRSDFQRKTVTIWSFYEKCSLFHCAFLSYLRFKIVQMRLTLRKPVFLLQIIYRIRSTDIFCFHFQLICSIEWAFFSA